MCVCCIDMYVVYSYRQIIDTDEDDIVFCLVLFWGRGCLFFCGFLAGGLRTAQVHIVSSYPSLLTPTSDARRS